VFMFIMPLLFAGPINNFWDDYKDRCKRNFLYTIFFLNNFSGGENLCINPTWYLANDVQFYFLTPLFIIPYVLKRAVGLIVTIATIIISMIVQAILIAHYELSTSTFKEAKGNEFKIYYSKPYCRINTYLIGVLVAWIYLSYKDKTYQNKTFDKITDKFKNSRAFRYIGYIIAVPTMIALIMLNYFFDHYLDTTRLENVLYMVLSRPLFITAAFVVVYPVILGHGRGLFGILAAPFMAPLAKLTYGTYLIHVPLLILEMLSTKRYIMFSSRYIFMRGLHLIFLAYTWSLIACLMIEAPMMKLEKILLFPKKALPPPKPTEDTEAPLTENK
jgi:peptidoglycan/LPS O-acetylase OafA/YrhL